MAKDTRTPAAVEAITPASLDAGPAAPPPAPARDEVAELKARLAALESENAGLKSAAPPAFPPGRRYLVTLRDAPSWVVEPQAGEHPWEAYRRATGVISSAHTPVITETEAPAGKA